MRPKKPPRIIRKQRKATPPATTFTDADLRAVEPGKADKHVKDPTTPGLSMKITPKDKRVFVFRYRSKGGKQRKLTLGTYPMLSVAEAKRTARAHWQTIYAGGDPASDLAARKNAVTCREFAQIYLQRQAGPRLAASTYKEYARVLETRVLPMVGDIPLVELSRSQVEAVHSSMGETPVRANRMLAVLKAMLFKAEDWGEIPRGSNPASRIRMFKEDPRRQYFNDMEQRRIFAAIEKLRAEMLRSGPAFDAITLLFFTGCRPSEVLKLRWEDVDLENASATLHATKTGEQTLLLSDPAVCHLQSIAREGANGWVFEGAQQGERLKSLTRPWRSICEEADVPQACLKDIRHTVGTYLAKEGSLYSAQAILRHASPAMTRRYAHPFEAAVRKDLQAAMTAISRNSAKKPR